MIQLYNIKKRYKHLEVLRGISLQINKGEIISLIGASGAGKSTLLQIIGLLDKPDEGEILYFNERVDHLSSKKLNLIRNQKMGFIFQFHHLFNEFTALENVCIPAWIKNNNPKEIKHKAQRLLQKVGLADRIHHKPKELSGGEQQRVAIARALINDPEIIFADEPTGNLDSHNAQLLHQIFIQLNKELNQTFLIVTHNQALTQLSHRVMTIKDGNLL